MTITEHPIRDAGVDQEPDAVALKDAVALGVLYLVAAAGVDHHRLDAGEMQQVRQHETGWSPADDAHGGGGDDAGHEASLQRVPSSGRPSTGPGFRTPQGRCRRLTHATSVSG